MHYRAFGRLDWKVSVLGFGAMRLPVLEGDPARIDVPEATRMLHYAIDNGVNYVDTAYGYHRGASEGFLGEALTGGYRERVKLATKMPCWLVKKREDFDTYFEEQLKRLRTPYIDFYLLHSLRKETWKTVADLDVLGWAEREISEGRIKHFGFSFHDQYDVFKEIVDAHRWDFCQIQYNYMDEEYQAGTRGLQYAAGRGLAVVVMEPLRGGQLARPPPEKIRELWEGSGSTRAPAEWALRWVWNHPEVSTVLSGMSTFQQVVQNIASAKEAGSHNLTREETELLGKVRDAYRTLCPIPCTKCGYCMPCAQGVEIPDILELYDEAVMYNDRDNIKRMYLLFLKEENRADKCTQCKECEDKCPQGIEVSEWMPKIHSYLTES